MGDMGDMLDLQLTQVGDFENDRIEAYRDSLGSAERLLLIVSVLGLALLALAAFLMIRSISRGLDSIVGSLKAIVSGDRTSGSTTTATTRSG